MLGWTDHPFLEGCAHNSDDPDDLLALAPMASRACSRNRTRREQLVPLQLSRKHLSDRLSEGRGAEGG